MKLRIYCILLLAVGAAALPIGDPRTPDKEMVNANEIAVEQGRHEISLHTFVGASKIDYPDIGGTKWSPGFGAAFTYNYFFLPRWSFLLGGGLQLFNNRGTAVQSDFQGSMYARDESGGGRDEVELFYNFEQYSENQWSLMFMIPVMFQHTSNETRNKAFYYALGAKLGIPFAGSYEGKAGKAQICGAYFDPKPSGYDECNDPDSPYAGMGEDSKGAGFGDFGKVSSHSKLKLSTAFFAAAEVGVKWRLYNKLAVYTGFWLDYALNDIAIAAVTNEPFRWTPNTGDPPKSVEGPWANVEFNSRTQNSKTIPVSMGVTVRFSLGAGTLHPEVDSLRWLKRLYTSDSLLELCNEDVARLKADSLRLADSIEFINSKVNALLDSLVHCRRACMVDVVSRSELTRMMDSLARESEKRRLAELEAARIAALEKARQDSIEYARRLEEAREGRLIEFRKKLNAISNGLDNYSVTQTVPSENAREKLDIAAELLKDYPDLKLRIVGHTCDMGVHDANVRFGRQRAESARNYLVNVKGIDFKRLDVQSRAELEPVVPNKDEASRRKNRRIQLEIIEGAEDLRKEAK